MTVVLAGLAFATSIDALIVGISLGLLELNPVHGCGNYRIYCTGFIAFLGVVFSKLLSKKFSNHVQIFGGIILILIGGKILFEHLN